MVGQFLFAQRLGKTITAEGFATAFRTWSCAFFTGFTWAPPITVKRDTSLRVFVPHHIGDGELSVTLGERGVWSVKGGTTEAPSALSPEIQLPALGLSFPKRFPPGVSQNLSTTLRASGWFSVYSILGTPNKAVSR
jgi:hypothetical protein